MSELDEASLTIGKLTGQVEALNDNLEHLINWIKESNTRMEEQLFKHTEADTKNFNMLFRQVDRLENFKSSVVRMASMASVMICSMFELGVTYFKK